MGKGLEEIVPASVAVVLSLKNAALRKLNDWKMNPTDNYPLNPADNYANRVLTESEQILNGLIILCKNGYHCVRSGPGYLVSGGPVMKNVHLALEDLGWHFCKTFGRWEFPVFSADPPQEPRNAGSENGELA